MSSVFEDIARLLQNSSTRRLHKKLNPLDAFCQSLVNPAYQKKSQRLKCKKAFPVEQIMAG